MATNNAFEFWKARASEVGNPKDPQQVSVVAAFQDRPKDRRRNASSTTATPARQGTPANGHAKMLTPSSRGVRRSSSVRPASTTAVGVYGSYSTLGPAFESSSTWYTLFTDRGEKAVRESEVERSSPISRDHTTSQAQPTPATPHIVVTDDSFDSRHSSPANGGTQGKPLPSPKPALNSQQKKKVCYAASTAFTAPKTYPNDARPLSPFGGRLKSSRSVESLVHGRVVSPAHKQSLQADIASTPQRCPSPRRSLSPSESGLFSPVTPREDLFVSASFRTEEEIAFSAMLERVHTTCTSPPPRPPAPLRKPLSSISCLDKLSRDLHGNRVPREKLCQVMSAFYSKVARFKVSLLDVDDDTSVQVMIGINHLDSLIGATKAVCLSVLQVAPASISTALQSSKRAMEAYLESSAAVKVPLASSIQKLEKAVEAFVADYCRYFCVGYQLDCVAAAEEEAGAGGRAARVTESHKVSSPLRVYVGCVGRLPKSAVRELGKYQLHVSLFHGTAQLCKKHQTLEGKIAQHNGLSPILDFNQWVNFGIPLAQLPLESRLVFSLYQSKDLQAVVSVNLFKSSLEFWSGTHFLCMWPGDALQDAQSCPVNPNSEDPGCLLLYCGLDAAGSEAPVQYSQPAKNQRTSIATDLSLQKIQRLKEIAKKNRFLDLKLSERELVWEGRYELQSLAGSCHHAVPLLVACMPTDVPACRAELHGALESWRLQEPRDALALLTAQFADVQVRSFAVRCLSSLSDAEVAAFIPQIVQSLKSDWSDASPTAELLLTKARSSRTIAHYLYWNLRHVKEERISSVRFHRLWAGLLKVVEKEQADDLNRQNLLLQSFVEVAKKVKEAKDKKATLLEELRAVEPLLKRECSLSVDPSIRVTGLNLDRCSYFSSFTVPLKLTFRCAGGAPDKGVIFKAGDDLRQDMLTIQMIRLFDSIWRKSGLDLKIITYGVVATGDVTGMLELVPDCQTLREIQTTEGVTGSLKDHILSDWLMRNNSSKTAYREAVQAFTASCAGYCVASYVLGICDRHNDNIMVTTSGLMFHIDYGKILGHAQMFGSIKRDRVPFVFTPDMAYVINGGEEKGENFQLFQDLCCSAYTELRHHTHLITNLLELMLTSDLPELSSHEDVKYVYQALLPTVSAQQASATFSKMIETSLKSVAPQINFVIHNFGQMKFSSKSIDEEDMLSFIPGSYSSSSDGVLKSVEVTEFQKKANPDKYHVYVVAVERMDGRRQVIFRRYREFYEFHEKLKEAHRGYQIPSMPEKLLRSNVQQVAEQRQVQLHQYLQDLMQLPSAVSQSDMVHTFLHCTVRDERDGERESPSDLEQPQVKLDMKYNRTTKSLAITVTHAKNLPRPNNTKGLPHPYVKMYLLPDEHKNNKRKTKTIENSRNPTFHETFTYTFQRTIVDSCFLQVSVWTKSFRGKECLGKVETQLQLFRLMGGVSRWFELSRDSTEKVLPWSSTHPTLPSRKVSSS